jgi:catechol 2,3-dioxygenase-like lactoylglutathione lyase family enzyme
MISDHLGTARWHHVAISVRDIDRALAFYRDLLGFALEWEMDHVRGEFVDEIVGLKDVDMRMAMLAGHGTRLELFQYHHPRGEDRGPRRQCDYGITHICLLVEDVRGLYERLAAAGVAFMAAPRNHRPGGWVTYMKDPEGVTIELLNPGDAVPSR